MTAETKVGVSGAWKELNGAPKVGVSGAWKTVREIYTGVSGAWKLAFVNLSFASGPDGNEEASDTGEPLTGTVDFNAAVTVSGGTAPYSYAWVRESVTQGVTQSDEGTNPNATGAMTIRGTSIPDGTPSINDWYVQVTDDDGNTVRADFTLTLTWNSTA